MRYIECNLKCGKMVLLKMFIFLLMKVVVINYYYIMYNILTLNNLIVYFYSVTMMEYF